VLSHRVHVLDRRARAQQRLSRRLELGHGDLTGRQRQQARPAARNEDEQQVVASQRFHALQDLLRGVLAGFVRHRVGRFDDGDPVREQSVLVARHDQTVERGVGGPALLDCERHRRGRFAGAYDECSTLGRLRQMLGDDL
jgi:hypothetical protein